MGQSIASLPFPANRRSEIHANFGLRKLRRWNGCRDPAECGLKFLAQRTDTSGQAITSWIARSVPILMIPPKTDPKWATLLKGDVSYRFSSAAASMLFFCLRAKVKSNNSATTLQQCADEAHAFFTKYERTLQQDIKAIFN
jgi:hypothetical protein